MGIEQQMSQLAYVFQTPKAEKVQSCKPMRTFFFNQNISKAEHDSKSIPPIPNN